MNITKIVKAVVREVQNDELALELYTQAIESFDEVARPIIHGGDETNPAYVAKAVKLARASGGEISCGICPYHRCENKTRKPKHVSWKDVLRTNKRWGNYPKEY